MRDLRVSITIDANPEGINQYSGAASKAEKSGTKARNLDKKGPSDAGMNAHMAAARDHLAAAKLAGSEGMKGWHEHTANVHHIQASAHAAGAALPYKFSKDYPGSPRLLR